MNMKLNSLSFIKDFARGAVIGVANIIPGVSGGTLALVLGIYERIIGALNNVTPQTVLAVLGLVRFNRESRIRFLEEWRKIDAPFLLTIGTGAVAAVVALAGVMTYLLEEWHDPTYGFFFGLVLVSALTPYRLIRRKRISVLAIMLLAVFLVPAVSGMVSDESIVQKARLKQERMLEKQKSSTGVSSISSAPTANSSLPISPQSSGNRPLRLLLLFVMGAVAISAMILPGVSGSFLLLLMGGYFDVIRALTVKEFDPLVIVVFGMGCLIGLILFTRLLYFLLRRYHDQTMGFLVGLVLGSLYVIWPFKKTVIVGGRNVYLTNHNILPGTFGELELLTVGVAILGMVIVGFMIWLEARTDPANPQS